MSRKKFSSKDYKALNSKGPAITRHPPGGGRAQVRIGTGIQKPPRTHETDRGNVQHAPPHPLSPPKSLSACEERHSAGRTYPDAEPPRGGGP